MLEPEDKEYLKLVIESSVNSAMKPVHKHIVDIDLKQQEQGQILTGVGGSNGLVGKVKKLEDFREQVNLKIAWVAGGVALGGTVVFKLIASFASSIISKGN